MWTETTLVVAAAAPAETKMALVAVAVAVVPAKKTTPLSVAAPKRRPRVAASNELCIELVTLFDSLCLALSSGFPMLPFLFSALREYQHHRHRPSQLPLIPNWLESSSSKQPAEHRYHRCLKAPAPKYPPRSLGRFSALSRCQASEPCCDPCACRCSEDLPAQRQSVCSLP